MDWPTTLAITAAAAGLTALFGWLGARPPDLSRGPRLVPWRVLMVLSAVGTLLMLVHMLNLAGVATGR
jgi:hypothetical protein